MATLAVVDVASPNKEPLSTSARPSRKWAVPSVWLYHGNEKLSIFQNKKTLKFFDKFNHLCFDEGTSRPCWHSSRGNTPLLSLVGATSLLRPLIACLRSEEKHGGINEEQLGGKNEDLLDTFQTIRLRCSNEFEKQYEKEYEKEVVEEFSLEDDICSFILAPNHQGFGCWARIFFFLKREDFEILDSQLILDNVSVRKHEHHGQFNHPISREQLEIFNVQGYWQWGTTTTTFLDKR